MKAFTIVIPIATIPLMAISMAYGQQATPPPEAYTACEGKSSGSAAWFVGPRGKTVDGICGEIGGRLVLLPNHIPSQRNQIKDVPSRRIELPSDSDQVYATRSVPDAESESDLKDKAFKTETVKVVGGKAALTVNWVPVFIEEKETTSRSAAAPRLSPFGFHPAYTYNAEMDRRKLREPSDVGYDYSPPTDMGVVWNRPEYYALWGKIQKSDSDISEGKFDWKETDYVYGSVPKAMGTMGNIGGTDRRTVRGEKPYPRTFSFKSEFYEKSFPLFVKKLVERYDGDGVDDMPGLSNPVKHWQIDNEPDLASRDWKGYARLMQAAGKAVKEACPDCAVVMGGMAFPKSLESFYVPVMKALEGKYIDVFDAHIYGMCGEWKGYKGSYDSIRTALDMNGFGRTDIWITETGTYSGIPKTFSMNSGGPGANVQFSQGRASNSMPAQSERHQAADVVKRYVYALSLGVKKVFWAFGIMEGFEGNGGMFDHTGFIYGDTSGDNAGRHVKKLAYHTYKLMTEKLEGSDFSAIREIELGAGVHAFKFLKSGRPVYVVWAY